MIFLGKRDEKEFARIFVLTFYFSLKYLTLYKQINSLSGSQGMIQ